MVASTLPVSPPVQDSVGPKEVSRRETIRLALKLPLTVMFCNYIAKIWQEPAGSQYSRHCSRCARASCSGPGPSRWHGRLARSLQEQAARHRAPHLLCAFLANCDGTLLKRYAVHDGFASSGRRPACGVARQPRLRDSRITSAVARLAAWPREGRDVRWLLSQLSPLLGRSSGRR